MMNKLLLACALMMVGGSALAATIDNTVPEPGTLALVALAVVAGVVARRGKK